MYGMKFNEKETKAITNVMGDLVDYLEHDKLSAVLVIGLSSEGELRATVTGQLDAEFVGYVKGITDAMYLEFSQDLGRIESPR